MQVIQGIIAAGTAIFVALVGYSESAWRFWHLDLSPAPGPGEHSVTSREFAEPGARPVTWQRRQGRARSALMVHPRKL